MTEQRFSDNESSGRDIPSFIEPRPPLIRNPYMRPRPEKGTNLLELFEEDSEIEEPELVQVYLRMKPCDTPNNLYEVRSDQCLVTSFDTTTAGHGRRTQHNVSRMYTFSRIFNAQCSQKEIFEKVVKENLKKLPDGNSFTLLTYGASGSGKTYTLMGNINSPGLVPRSLEYVFKLVDAAQHPIYKPSDGTAEKLGYAQQELELQWVKRLRHISAPQRDKYRRMSAQLRHELTISTFDLTNRTKHYVWVSFVEIYNEAIYDLLAPPEKRAKLRIREDTSGQVYVKGVTQAFVKTGEEAYDVMVAGKHNLVVAATGIHANSSRSHCIFTITMLTEKDGEIRTSCIRLCDLAGCERARATRNTGARMLESRAINSSLHVLERCLHLLRRNQMQRQETRVPYRESKLTRLLGSGLSGSRGEAVSMVVTLNPSPLYAAETKHVLSLAAVAQDIQVNNTAMYASTLESTQDSQDTTLATSAELMRLRADNERLHFELVQAEARIKEQQAAMETEQEEGRNAMLEVVEEAKDITRQYYETQMDALRKKMEEMIEEYEERLSKAVPAFSGTPNRHLQAKVELLVKEITVLEEKLSAEQLARECAEKQVQHLHTCIYERDEKPESDVEKRELVLTDSDDEEDPFNQSLEPVFRQAEKTKTHKEYQTDLNCMDLNEDDEINLEKSLDSSKNSAYETGEDTKLNVTTRESTVNLTDSRNDMTEVIRNVNHTLQDSYNISLINDDSKATEVEKCLVRGTYFVSDIQEMNHVEMVDEFVGQTMDDNDKIEIAEIKPRGTYFVRTSCVDTSIDEAMEEMEVKTIEKTPIAKNEFKVPKERVFESEKKPKELAETQQDKVFASERKPNKVSDTFVNKILKSLKSQSNSSESSLRQFEQLEMASEKCDDTNNAKSLFADIKILKEKRTYFNESKENIEKIQEQNAALGIEEFISCNKTKSVEESFEDNKNEPRKSLNTDGKDLEKNKYSSGEILISNPQFKRNYFDDIEMTNTIPNKTVADIKSRKNEERSPSIVKDENDKQYEPSTMKILLGDNLPKSDNNINKAPLHYSIDVFESPLIVKATRENESATPVTKSNLDEVRESIKKLVIEQKTRSKQDDKTDLNSSTEEQPIKQSSDENNKAKVSDKECTNDSTCKVVNETQNEKENNTIDEFESIYKKLSTERPTHFDLLVTEDTNASNVEQTQAEKDKENEVGKTNEHSESKSEDVKYNLRHRGKSVLNTSDDKKVEFTKRVIVEEVLAGSSTKSAIKAKPSKKLRLRRRKNDESTSDQENIILKDIMNLKKEFSDVTMGLPAVKKEVVDIPSPERSSGEEFLPPTLCIQSCPSKSVTRSRRKLFTPRAEPLEESMTQAGDSNERLYVPRPSYHRTRARRKL